MKNLYYLSKIVLIAIVALCINACDKDEIDVKYDITGDWKVVSYKTSTVITKTEENTWSQFNNGDVTLNFTETDLTSGNISGIKVTNSFSGDYTIDNKGAITISNLFQTMINEPEWGRLFDSIRNVESYEVLDNRLIIYYNQKKNNITLEKLNE
ncbi:MAG: META domain-containing protein [Prolixibacteraceae bacterium]|nr:META domain-containing protein [Prolixibacteraceae bacterium]